MAQLRFKRLRPDESDIELPSYSTAHAAGMDLRISEALTIEPDQIVMAPTGLAVEIPEGFEGQVRPRSGLAAKHGITCLNTPGTIDADYRGEIKIILINHGKAPVTFNRGDRIAQFVLARYERAEIVEAESLSESARGTGGFGHTGVQ